MLGLGHVLKTVGRQDEAIKAYRDCIQHVPQAGETWWSLANLKTYRFSDEDIEQMQSLVSGGDEAEEEVLEYWSSGSTSMYGLKGAGKQASAEHED